MQSPIMMNPGEGREAPSHRQNLKLGCHPPQGTKLQVTRPKAFHRQSRKETKFIACTPPGNLESQPLMAAVVSRRTDYQSFSTTYGNADQGDSPSFN